jgi:hypothetical protein
LPSTGEEATLRIWPNPATTTLRGAWQVGEELSILNMKGQLLQTIKITTAAQEIQIAHLPKGVYQLQLASKGSSWQNGLLLKVR